MTTINFTELTGFLKKIPAIDENINTGIYENNNWWLKFSLDINHDLAWHVVQELSHVINYLSVNERLPAIFYPVSAPPYLNGGPEDHLYWIIESKDKDFPPAKIKEWLKSRLPDPVDDEAVWEVDE